MRRISTVNLGEDFKSLSIAKKQLAGNNPQRIAGLRLVTNLEPFCIVL